MSTLLRTYRRRRAADAGFTLVEVIVSIGVLIIAMLALLTGLVTALQGVVMGRANQQAGDVANAELERIRSFDYGQITLAAGDVTIPAVSSYEGQPLAIAPAGAVQPARTTFDADGRTYRVQRWVTNDTLNPAGAATVRRVTVEVRFTVNDVEHLRRASTLVTNTRRGLPLPNFRFDYNGSAPTVSDTYRVNVTPGSEADFGFVLRNLGARDTWNLSASQAGWTFHLDTNHNGVVDDLEPLLTDTDANGQPDTKPIEPSSAPLYIAATKDYPLGTPIGITPVTFTATSSAQPAAGAKAVLGSVNVTTTATAPTPAPTPSDPITVACTGGSPTVVNATAGAPSTSGGYSILSLIMQNGPHGDSVTRNPMTLSRDTTTQPAYCNYSTNWPLFTSAGRVLPALVPAAWDYAPSNGSAKDRQFRGTGVVKVWVRCAAGTTPTITATFGLQTTLAHSASGSTTLPAASCDGTSYRAASVSVPNIDVSSGGNLMQLRLSSNQQVTLLYDAPSAGAYFAVGTKK